MFERIRNTLHPAGYHGRSAHPPYFQGWYFKLVNAAVQHRYAIIPGISLGAGGDGPHAFVQVLDGSSGATDYHVFPTSAFEAATDRLCVRVGPNTFSERGVSLDLPGEHLHVRGRLAFDSFTPWPVTPFEPGTMGWYAWVPRMECYHGVFSLDHALEGTLTVNGATVDFGGGRGYSEGDWGQSFPSAWVWTQSNHFAEAGTCLTASIAVVPWLGTQFRGFTVGLLHRGTLYRFATYTGARTERIAVDSERVSWVLRDRLYRLEIAARRAGAPLGALRGPSRQDMGRRVPEALTATLDVQLTALHDGSVLFEGSGHSAGLEAVGRLC